MDANLIGTLIITHALAFALAWIIQDLRQAGKQLQKAKEDLADTKRRFPAKK